MNAFHNIGIIIQQSSLIPVCPFGLPLDHHDQVSPPILNHLLSHLPLPLLKSPLRLTLHLTRRASSLALNLLLHPLRLPSNLTSLSLRLSGTHTGSLLGFLSDLPGFLETRDGGAGDGFVGCFGCLFEREGC